MQKNAAQVQSSGCKYAVRTRRPTSLDVGFHPCATRNERHKLKESKGAKKNHCNMLPPWNLKVGLGRFFHIKMTLEYGAIWSEPRILQYILAEDRQLRNCFQYSRQETHHHCFFQTHTIHVWFISLHLVDFYGKCKEL